MQLIQALADGCFACYAGCRVQKDGKEVPGREIGKKKIWPTALRTISTRLQRWFLVPQPPPFNLYEQAYILNLGGYPANMTANTAEAITRNPGSLGMNQIRTLLRLLFPSSGQLAAVY